jgi:hypothetical protein
MPTLIYQTTICKQIIKNQQPAQIISNCLCEALKYKNKELLFFLIQLENVKFNQETIKFTINYCLNMLNENKIDDYYKNLLRSIFPYLLSYLKVIPDK